MNNELDLDPQKKKTKYFFYENEKNIKLWWNNMFYGFNIP